MYVCMYVQYLCVLFNIQRRSTFCRCVLCCHCQLSTCCVVVLYCYCCVFYSKVWRMTMTMWDVRCELNEGRRGFQPMKIKEFNYVSNFDFDLLSSIFLRFFFFCRSSCALRHFTRNAIIQVSVYFNFLLVRVRVTGCAWAQFKVRT